MTNIIKEKTQAKSEGLQKSIKRGTLSCEEARNMYLGYLTCLVDLGYISPDEKKNCMEKFCLETL